MVVSKCEKEDTVEGSTKYEIVAQECFHLVAQDEETIRSARDH